MRPRPSLKDVEVGLQVRWVHCADDSRVPAGDGVGHLALGAVDASSPIADMDRLVVSLHGGVSVFAAALYHAIMNVSWLLFPNYGSHRDPRITGLITAFAAAVVKVTWGPRTLARYGNA